MPKLAEDITDAIIHENVLNICAAQSIEETTDILMGFCERYRKNYNTRRDRVKHRDQKERFNEYSKKCWDKNKHIYNEKRNAKNRAKRAERDAGMWI